MRSLIAHGWGSVSVETSGPRTWSRIAPTMKATPFLLAVIFAATLSASAQPALPSADSVMALAKTQAAAEHKNILLVFSASWCGPCKMFEAFLDDPKTGPV